MLHDLVKYSLVGRFFSVMVNNMYCSQQVNNNHQYNNVLFGVKGHSDVWH